MDKPIQIYPKTFLKNAVIVVAFLILFYALTAAEKESYTSEELNESGGSYTVLVPYVEKEYYQEKVHYGKTICPSEYYLYNQTYEMQNQIIETDTGEKLWHLVCILTITNKEDQAGDFTFMSIFDRKSGKIDMPPITKTIEAQGTEVFEWKKEMDNFGDIIACTPKRYEIPEMEKCRPLDPNQFTYVNKYRNVTKYRNETRFKETKVIGQQYKYVNRLFGYNQFFYLGY